jgi:Glyoxalase/Bleomycin resistance protein/Dioxygenase superfamily
MHGSCCMVDPRAPRAELGDLRAQSQLRTLRHCVPGSLVRAVRTGWPTAVLVASLTVPGAIHHSVVVVCDLEASLRFYRDGIGFELLADRQLDGDWPHLLDAPSRRVRAVFLATREFLTTTPVSWSSACSMATFRKGHQPRR